MSGALQGSKGTEGESRAAASRADHLTLLGIILVGVLTIAVAPGPYTPLSSALGLTLLLALGAFGSIQGSSWLRKLAVASAVAMCFVLMLGFGIQALYEYWNKHPGPNTPNYTPFWRYERDEVWSLGQWSSITWLVVTAVTASVFSVVSRRVRAQGGEVIEVEIRPALPEDHDAGSVWLTLPSSIRHRSVVKIERDGDSGRIFCEALAIGPYFVERYNQRIQAMSPKLPLSEVEYGESGRALPNAEGRGFMFVNAYYREKLGNLPDFTVVTLHISRADKIWGQTRASFEHPQLGIRLAIKLGLWGLILGSSLGVLSVILGFIGVRLGMLGLHKT